MWAEVGLREWKILRERRALTEIYKVMKVCVEGIYVPLQLRRFLRMYCY